MTISLNLDPAFAGEVRVPGPVTSSALPVSTSGKNIWPRMLVLSEDTERRLRLFLENELDLCWAERNQLSEDWIQWHKDYWAKPVKKVNNFPFQRAANVVIPMTAIAVEAIYARLITTIFSVKPFYSIRPRTPEWIETASQMESWFQTKVEDSEALDMDGFARESLLEIIKLGTGIGKSGYEKDIRKVNIDLPDGTTSSKWITKRDGPTLDYVPLANFLMRLHERDPQTAVWVGEEHRNISWTQLKRNALSGRMRPEVIEEIKAWWGSRGMLNSTAQKIEDATRKLDGTEPAWNDVFSFIEIWMSFDVDGDGVDEEIVVEFHRESGKFLSYRYNWYSDAHRPYRIGVYIPVEGRWMGIGVGKQNEQFQALITTVHRQRLDAGTLANMGMVALKKSSGYGPDEPIFPGKMWFLEDPTRDIQNLSMSNTQHFAQISNEDNARQYADKRTGANELILGTPAAGTPATATSDLAKLAEGNKKFDMVLKNVRRFFSLLGLDTLTNYQQFGTRDQEWLIRGEGGKYVRNFFQMPQEDIRSGLFVDLTVTDSITNRDQEQIKWTQLFSVLSAHYDKVLERAGQVAGVLKDPSLYITFAGMALKASNTAMRRLLGAYSVPDIDSFLLDLEATQNAQSQGIGGPPSGNRQLSPGSSDPTGGGGPTTASGDPNGVPTSRNGILIEQG